VIVDFKTDRLEGSADEIERRAEAYRSQEERYALAVARAFELDRPPRVELWFLWADAIVARS
jgi:ATP-dependent exoDNAse (exonuclease V) beta subunit